MHSHYQNEMNWKGNATSREYKSEKHEFYGQSSLEVSNSCTEVFHTGYLQQVCIARLRKLSKSFHSTSKVLSWKHDFKSNTNDVTFLWRSQLVMSDKKKSIKQWMMAQIKKSNFIYTTYCTQTILMDAIFQIIFTLNVLNASPPQKAKILKHGTLNSFKISSTHPISGGSKWTKSFRKQ